MLNNGRAHIWHHDSLNAAHELSGVMGPPPGHWSVSAVAMEKNGRLDHSPDVHGQQELYWGEVMEGYYITT